MSHLVVFMNVSSLVRGGHHIDRSIHIYETDTAETRMQAMVQARDALDDEWESLGESRILMSADYTVIRGEIWR